MANRPQQLVTRDASSDSEANAFDPWILWVTFRRTWPWSVPAGAAMAGLAALFVLQGFEPRYRASHLLEANEDYVVFKGVMPTVEDLARTEKSLLLNAIVLDPILEDANLRRAPSLSNPETAETNLKKNLSISNGGTRSRLVVSYEDTDRDAAALVCNAIVDSYQRQRDSFDNTRVNNLEKWLDPEIQRWEQEVEIRQQKVHRYSEQALGFAPGKSIEKAESDSSVASLNGLRSEIGDLKIELALFDVQEEADLAAALEGELVAGIASQNAIPKVVLKPTEPSELEIQRGIELDEEVREVRGLVKHYQSVVLGIESQGMQRITPDHYSDSKASLAEAKTKLEKEKELAKGRVAKQLRALAENEYQRQLAIAEEHRKAEAEQRKLQREQTAVALSDRKSQLNEAFKARRAMKRKAMQARLVILEDQYDAERKRLEQFGGTTADLQFAQDELAVANGVLTKLRDRVAAIRTERRQDGAVRTLAEATPPRSPVEAAPFKKLSFVSLAAFCIPYLFGLLWEFKVQRVTDAVSFEKGSELAPVVGEIARLPSGTRSEKGRRVFEESIDSLRANLFLSLNTRDTRSVAVVSSMSGEGKSSVASQLALSIAKAMGKTVLLVDGDLRCPDQHEIFGLEMGPGLAGVLAGDAKLEDAVDQSLGDLVHVLPAGRLTASPHRLVNPSAMRDFVDAALGTYEFVVVDTAPVLSAGETLAVASAVDSTLLCVMRDVSRKDNVMRTTRRLEAAGATIAGTVFSGVSPRQYAYRYGDYHYALAGEQHTT